MGSSSGEGWPTSARSPIVASMPATALFSLTCSSRELARGLVVCGSRLQLEG